MERNAAFEGLAGFPAYVHLNKCCMQPATRIDCCVENSDVHAVTFKHVALLICAYPVCSSISCRKSQLSSPEQLVQVSIATVVTVEQAAAYLAKGDTTTMADMADMFLKTLATLETGGTARGGGAFTCLRDTTCVVEVLVDTVQGLEKAEAAAAGTVATQESSQAASSQAPAASPADGFSPGV
jgi:hypothetical protein